ncbi:MAG: formyltransferase family protein [Chitinophagaceae bacterium]
MRIAILCNSRIALPALSQLLQTGMVAAVGIAVSMQEIKPLVQQRCMMAGVPLQVFTKRTFHNDIVQWVQQYQPDVVLVKTFPYLVPAQALSIPKYGFLNFHYAPLPEWRGANPLFWMIRNKTSMGAVTVHEMTETFDTGPILLQYAVPLSPDASFGLFCTQLAYAGLQVSGALLNGLLQGNLQKKEQDHTKAQWYGRPVATDLIINWQTMDAGDIKALVNACNPWNKGAATCWNGWMFGISNASVCDKQQEIAEPGTILSVDEKNGLTIACRDGKAISADVVYCEEGFYPGHHLAGFGLQKGNRLV